MKWKQNFRNVCKVITKKKLKYHIYISKLLMVEAPLAAITALSLLGYDATSFAHLDWGIFWHSSLQILSSSVRLDWERRWTAIFRSLQRCSIGFKSGLWLGPSRTFKVLPLSHHCVALAVCLGSLSCWKVNLQPSLRSWALWNWFSLRISLYFDPFSFPSTLTNLPVPATEKQPHSMRLLPAHFTLGWYSAGDEQSWIPSNMMLRIEVHQTR